MKTEIQNIQTKLLESAAKYVDEDWGQLDYYTPNFPVQWPCILIDVTAANFDDIGKDRKAVPQNRQQAIGIVTLTIANLKLTNTSGRSPQLQKDNAWSIWDLINETHQLMQGFRISGSNGAMLRRSVNRIKRDDGVQQYDVTYAFSLNNV